MIQRKEYVWQGARSIDTTQEEVCARMDAKIPLAGLVFWRDAPEWGRMSLWGPCLSSE
jgi:hypothetical protein